MILLLFSITRRAGIVYRIILPFQTQAFLQIPIHPLPQPRQPFLHFLPVLLRSQPPLQYLILPLPHVLIHGGAQLLRDAAEGSKS